MPPTGQSHHLPIDFAARYRRATDAQQAGENGELKRKLKDENGKMKIGLRNERMKGMRAETGRIKGDLQERTKTFALDIISFYSQLPKGRREAQVLGDQVMRSGTSVGAHFREAQRAKSKADFINKIEGGMQELEETAYWLELLEGSKLCQPFQLEPLMSEADQLMAIFVTIVRKTKSGMAKPKF